MKNILTVFLIGGILYSCSNPNNSLKKDVKPVLTPVEEPAAVSDSKMKENTAENKKESTEWSAFPIKQVVEGYLPLKNALTKDDAEKASGAAKTLLTILKKIDIDKLELKKSAELHDIVESAAENAEHIGGNSDDIAHQREHLLLLSNDIADLIGETGTGGLKLYQDFCPMYNNGKGGTWISELKEIVNPYEGSKMINCGSIKKIL